MKSIRKKTFCAILLSIFFIGTQAQQVVPAAGGEASGSGGTASYSVGQIVYKTNSGTNGSLAEGVQQPFEISEIIGIEEAKTINLKWKIYPNPTRDVLKLNIGNYESEYLFYQLYDLNGKIISKEKIINKESNINISALVSAIYFLKIIDNDKEIKTFKIIKNK